MYCELFFSNIISWKKDQINTAFRIDGRREMELHVDISIIGRMQIGERGGSSNLSTKSQCCRLHVVVLSTLFGAENHEFEN